MESGPTKISRLEDPSNRPPPVAGLGSGHSDGPGHAHQARKGGVAAGHPNDLGRANQARTAGLAAGHPEGSGHAHQGRAEGLAVGHPDVPGHAHQARTGVFAAGHTDGPVSARHKSPSDSHYDVRGPDHQLAVSSVEIQESRAAAHQGQLSKISPTDLTAATSSWPGVNLPPTAAPWENFGAVPSQSFNAERNGAVHSIQDGHYTPSHKVSRSREAPVSETRADLNPASDFLSSKSSAEGFTTAVSGNFVPAVWSRGEDNARSAAAMLSTATGNFIQMMLQRSQETPGKRSDSVIGPTYRYRGHQRDLEPRGDRDGSGNPCTGYLNEMPGETERHAGKTQRLPVEDVRYAGELHARSARDMSEFYGEQARGVLLEGKKTIDNSCDASKYLGFGGPGDSGTSNALVDLNVASSWKEFPVETVRNPHVFKLEDMSLLNSSRITCFNIEDQLTRFQLGQNPPSARDIAKGSNAKGSWPARLEAPGPRHHRGLWARGQESTDPWSASPDDEKINQHPPSSMETEVTKTQFLPITGDSTGRGDGSSMIRRGNHYHDGNVQSFTELSGRFGQLKKNFLSSSNAQTEGSRSRMDIDDGVLRFGESLEAADLLQRPPHQMVTNPGPQGRVLAAPPSTVDRGPGIDQTATTIPQVNSISVIQKTPPVSFAAGSKLQASLEPKVEIKQEDDGATVPERLSISADNWHRFENEGKIDVENILKFLHYNHKKFRMRPNDDGGNSFLVETILGHSRHAARDGTALVSARTTRDSVIVASRTRGPDRRVSRRDVDKRPSEEDGTQKDDICGRWRDMEDAFSGGELDIKAADNQDILDNGSVEELQNLLQVSSVVDPEVFFSDPNLDPGPAPDYLLNMHV
jgi:hypothetical protein